ncbi:Na/Pi cotransporter family protein [Sinorhizobium meliloti]|uniref:Na/Pi cotransporter family protein n=1 Tax=Rhizobium meliloti TaxID=382 RepID=UPI000FD4C8CE|nr:Na/Pi cotransporter family protein [Sinorhizobium meliloti]MDX0574433.1 hypothetical protein [Sinorhizobium medicae]MDX0673403.1 hypothetical protein [Sinorhizobium medicae]MDX0710610.1 hypothetical protein [Sinorhizobium medicae]RVI12224.1 Na/Pi cotransporter family protein [Sinorhizobium meliloti]RVL76710.1 Na/Pi cotransporter family protein [Sinorhizobium meliloti]
MRVLSDAGSHGAALLVDAHIVFNITLPVVILPLPGPLSNLMRLTVPEAETPDDRPRYLDLDNLDTPALALAGAARETLRIGGRIAAMIEASREQYVRAILLAAPNGPPEDYLHAQRDRIRSFAWRRRTPRAARA